MFHAPGRPFIVLEAKNPGENKNGWISNRFYFHIFRSPSLICNPFFINANNEFQTLAGCRSASVLSHFPNPYFDAFIRL